MKHHAISEFFVNKSVMPMKIHNKMVNVLDVEPSKIIHVNGHLRLKVSTEGETCSGYQNLCSNRCMFK